MSSQRILEENLALHPCRFDGTLNHKTSIFKIITNGSLDIDKKEFKSFDWFTKEEIKKLNLEPMWEAVFRKIGIIV